jgi:hypothetical protein
MKKLARKQPSTLQGLMDKVDEFINQEETLKAMTISRPSQEGSLKRKKKEFNQDSIYFELCFKERRYCFSYNNNNEKISQILGISIFRNKRKDLT